MRTIEDGLILCCDFFAFANIPPVKYRMSRRDKRKYRPKIRVGRMHWGPTRHKICVGRVPHVPHGSGAYAYMWNVTYIQLHTYTAFHHHLPNCDHDNQSGFSRANA